MGSHLDSRGALKFWSVDGTRASESHSSPVLALLTKVATEIATGLALGFLRPADEVLKILGPEGARGDGESLERQY